MKERVPDRWLSIALSVVAHAVIAGLLLWGFWRYHHPVKPPLQALAIEATVVDASQLPPGTLPKDVAAPAAPHSFPEPESRPLPEPQPEPLPAPPPAAPVPEPVPPVPDRDAQRKAEQAQAEKVQAEKARAEKARAEKAQAEQVRAGQEKAARAKAEKDKAEKEKAEKDKAQAEQARAEKARQDAERKAKAEADRVAREKADADRQTAQREAELRTRMAAEERFAAAKASGLLAQYQAQIRARIERAWIRPASAKPGLSCEVRITQVPGGEVTGVQVGSCNGDETVRQSIEAAAYRASPLPLPPDPSLFDRNLVVTFRPQD